MTFCTEDMSKSAWIVALETYHGASTVIRNLIYVIFRCYLVNVKPKTDAVKDSELKECLK
jgi:hypothetical protein